MFKKACENQKLNISSQVDTGKKGFKSIVLGKEAKESQVPSDIAEKIDQIRSCTRIHAEISDNDSNVIPESCYDPVEAELKFAALESMF